MKLLSNWLKKLLGTKKSPEQLVEPFEAEEIVKVGGNLSGVVVGQILEIKKHPNADRLNVAKVDVGEKNPRQIVFGQMAKIEIGNKIPVALAPTILPGNKEINEVELRGVLSQGMLCLDQEIGIKKDGISITFFNEEEIVGTPIAEALNRA
jgi:phenylalanyl-tRNA synthetase beta chain